MPTENIAVDRRRSWFAFVRRWLGTQSSPLGAQVKLLVGIGVFDVACAVAGAVVTHWVHDSIAPAAAFAAVALGTFVGLLLLGYLVGGAVTAAELRDAIAGSIVVVYLLLVIFLVFGIATPSPTPALTTTVIQNFTVTTGVVIAFYFGTIAIRGNLGSQAQGSQPKPDDPNLGASEGHS
jgi:hypothetical protein